MNRQRGAVLILALTLLVALAALTLASFRGADIQQLLAAGQRDREATLADAEATLAAARDALMAETSRPRTCNDGSCGVYARNQLPLDSGNDWEVANDGWWQANATAPGGTDGRYVLEYIGFVRDDLGVGDGGNPGRDFYRVIARSTGSQPGTRVVLEAVYARRFAN